MSYFIRNTINTHFQYTKSEINPTYLNKNNSKKSLQKFTMTKNDGKVRFVLEIISKKVAKIPCKIKDLQRLFYS